MITSTKVSLSCASAQFVGMCILVGGACAWAFQDTLSNLSLLTMTSLNPLTILVIASFVAFIISFTACMGSIGAWNENLVMLSGYSTVAAIFILQGLDSTENISQKSTG